MIRVALAQVAATADPAANLNLVEEGIGQAAAAGARLVVFPEATMCRFGVPLGPVAEPVDGPWAEDVRTLADAAGITVVAGMFTPSDDGRVRNTLLATGRNVDTWYDKIHLYDAFGFAESDTVAPGASPATFVLDGHTVGLATCYDVRFPALFDELALRGADLVVMPASWGAGVGKRAQWDVLVRARALDCGAFVAACDQADPSSIGRNAGSAPAGIGASLVADPFGQVVGQLGAVPATLIVEIDLARAAQARAATGVIVNARDFARTKG